MKAIEPNDKFTPDWEYGDIIKFDNKMFIISGLNFKPLLVELDSGDIWYKARRSNLDELRTLIKDDHKSVVHYSKSQYRMYLEAL